MLPTQPTQAPRLAQSVLRPAALQPPAEQGNRSEPTQEPHTLPVDPATPGSSSEWTEVAPRKRKCPSQDPSADQPAPERVSRPPPIVINGIKNVILFIRQLRDAVQLHQSTVLSLRAGDSVNIGCREDDEYRRVVLYLQTRGIEFHTFSNEKAFHARLVIRGLDVYSDPAEVADMLRELGYPVKDAIRLYTVRGVRRPLPLIRVVLPRGDDAERLLGLTNMYGLRIRVERSREAGNVTQCHRCQRYGHGSDMCHNSVVCVRCARAHPTKNCTVPPGVGHRCINCGGQHSANYRGCPIYKQQTQIAAANRYKLLQRQTENRSAPERSTQAFPALAKKQGRPNAQQPTPQVEPEIEEDSMEVAEPSRATSPVPPARYRLPAKPKKGKTVNQQKKGIKPQSSRQAVRQQDTHLKRSVSATRESATPITKPCALTRKAAPPPPAPARQNVSYAAATRKQKTSSCPTDGDALTEVKNFIAEYDLVEVARVFRSIRERLQSEQSPTERFLLLAEAAAAIGLL